MIGNWRMMQDQTLNFEAFADGPAQAVPAEPAPGPRPVGVGDDLVPTEDARALQARLAAEIAAGAGPSGQGRGSSRDR